MSAVGLIPARWGSTRFPGKVLAPIAGRPMLQRVFEGARSAKRLRAVWVATDDQRVARACRGFGAPVAMTSPECRSGTERLAEACRRVPELRDEIVVNIQGDEPLIEGFVVDAAVAALEETPDAPMSTVVHRAEPGALEDPHRVKVVRDRAGFALYFSRAAIPYAREGRPEDAPLWQHVGLYAYRREFLLRYAELPPTPLERAECLEQLRALEHGHRIVCAEIQGWTSAAVDVPDDVARVEARLAARGGR